MSNDEAEKAAREWADNRCPEQGPEFVVWCMCREDFLAGVEWERDKMREIMRTHNWDGAAWTLRPEHLDEEK